MSLSGFTNFPSGSGQAVQNAQKINFQQLAVRLLNSPENLPESRNTQYIVAEVTQTGPRNQARITTQYGEISVETRGKNQLRQGQVLELVIEPKQNNPAQPSLEATLRPKPAEAISVSEDPRLIVDQVVDQVTQSQRTDASAKITAELIEVSKTLKEALSPARVVTLENGDEIRLINIPKERLEKVIQQPKLLNTPVLNVDNIKLELQIITVVSPSETTVNYVTVHHDAIKTQEKLPQHMPTDQQRLLTTSPLSNVIVTDKPSPEINLNRNYLTFQTAQIVNESRFESVSEARLSINQQGGEQSTYGAVQPKSVEGTLFVSSGKFHNETVPQYPETVSAHALQDGYGSFSQNTAHDTQNSNNPAQQAVNGQNFLLNGSPNAFSYKVVGITSSQHAVLQPVSPFFTSFSGEQPLFLITAPIKPEHFPVGSIVTLSSTNFSYPVALIAEDSWSTLFQNIIQSSALSVSGAGEKVTSLLPHAQSPTKATSALLFLFAAFGGGQAQLGQSDKAQNKDLAKLFEALEKTVKDTLTNPRSIMTASGEWRSFALPMQTQEGMNPLFLYVQNREQENNHGQGGPQENKETQAVRFIVNLELSKMGPFQIDGLMRSGNLDLFVRTMRPLTSEMKTKIRDVYLNSLESSNLTGDVAFQTKDQKWMDMAPIISAKATKTAKET